MAFSWRDQVLHCEELPLDTLLERFGSPLYVYSQAAITERYRRLRSAFGEDALIAYAVKANSNRHILQLLADLGCGFDLVSGGELARLQAAGLAASDVVFAGVAKQEEEIATAVAAGIRFFNVESLRELPLLAAAGRAAGRRVPVAVRLNPDVEAGTHDYISTGKKGDKFGLDFAQAARAIAEIRAADRDLELVGVHVHLGSQLHRVEPYVDALDRIEAFLDADPAHSEGLRYYDLGGGFGIEGEGLDVAALAEVLLPRIQARGLQPVLEPGRYLVARAGLLLCRVLGRKPGPARDFLLVDGAMNDLLRPALYGARHPLSAVAGGPERPLAERSVDVVGPVCESGDFLARDVQLPDLAPGEALAVLEAGAYGAAMASNYNSRLRPAEVLVDGDRVRRIRRREEYADLWSLEVDE